MSTQTTSAPVKGLSNVYSNCCTVVDNAKKSVQETYEKTSAAVSQALPYLKIAALLLGTGAVYYMIHSSNQASARATTLKQNAFYDAEAGISPEALFSQRSFLGTAFGAITNQMARQSLQFIPLTAMASLGQVAGLLLTSPSSDALKAEKAKLQEEREALEQAKVRFEAEQSAKRAEQESQLHAASNSRELGTALVGAGLRLQMQEGVQMAAQNGELALIRERNKQLEAAAEKLRTEKLEMLRIIAVLSANQKSQGE